MLKNETGRAGAHDKVVQARGTSDLGNRVFQRADQIILEWTKVAAAIKLQKPGAELRLVDLYLALPCAGFARQAASHCLIDFVGKVLLPDLLPNRINSS
ncbi:hypothetical protein PLA106_23478, partial [Pseudomonas amygdali pv. lachrymans str. M302278]